VQAVEIRLAAEVRVRLGDRGYWIGNGSPPKIRLALCKA
jgi:hypothetical protein